MSAGHAWGGKAWMAACAAVTVAKLWLVSAQWLVPIWPSPADDGLYVTLARSILAGEWLGRLDAYTMAKGPVYPLWLAVVHLSGVRLLVAQAVLYALAAALLVVALRPVLRPGWRPAVLYLAVLLNPVSWANGPATRVSRDGFYSSLSLAFLALVAGAALRAGRGPRASVAWAALAGFTGSLVVMTREEGVWLAPSVAILVVLGAVVAGRAAWRHSVLLAGVAATAYAIPTMTVAALNWKHYGIAETAELRSGHFASAYGALTRVRPTHWSPYVPVPKETRVRIYEQSPAFRELMRPLEQEAANWTTHGCREVGECRDIAGGWFVWAFRLAAAEAGKYKSGPVARTWYEEVEEEIDRACREGRLDCTGPRASLAPPWHAQYLRPVVTEAGRALAYMATMEGVSAEPSQAMGSPIGLETVGRIVNEAVWPAKVRMTGTLFGTAGQVAAVVIDSGGRQVPATHAGLEAIASPALARGDVGRRVEIETSCTSGCSLALLSQEARITVVPVEEGSHVKAEGVEWRTDRFERITVLDEAATRGRWKLSMLDAVTMAYRWLVPVLAVLGFVAVCRKIASPRRFRVQGPAIAVACALLAAVLSRAALVAFISASSFPAVRVTYLAPAYPLLVAFAVLAVLAGAGPSTAERQYGRTT